MDEPSKLDPNDMMARIKAQSDAQMGEAFREQVTTKCFNVCVTSPGKLLTTRESTCVERCLDRFVDAMNVVTEALASRSNRGF